MRRVLVVDDEEHLRLVLTMFLRKQGYEVETAASAEERANGLERVCVVVSDRALRRPGTPRTGTSSPQVRRGQGESQ